MSLKELLDKRKIEKVEKSEFDVSRAISDLKSAAHSLEYGDFDWTLSIAYNAVLRVSRTFMFSLGYRSIGKEHHKNVFLFLKELGVNPSLVNYFDNVRKKRNKFIYDIFEGTSKESAEKVLKKAKKFVQDIRTIVQENRTEIDTDFNLGEQENE